MLVVKNVFVTTKQVFCQTRVCHDKSYFTTKIFCHDKTRVCCDKTFVVTKMIVAAAPTNDTPPPHPSGLYEANKKLQ